MMAMPSSSSWGADARYLPTRSDPLSPVGPPRGEDPRFDRLYDIIREVIQVFFVYSHDFIKMLKVGNQRTSCCERRWSNV